jgi:uncharacterized iron-regulated membrane protein
VHRAIALMAGALIVLVSASGAILVFRPELDDVVFGGAVRVESAPTTASRQALLDAARARHPDLAPRALLLPEAADRPARVHLEARSGETVEVLVDPSTSRVIASRWLERSPLQALRALHTTLYLGAAGSWITAALGLLLVAQGAIGLFLWWPFTRRPSRALTIRRGRRWSVLAYDAHKVAGIGALAVNLVLALTGALLAVSAAARHETAAPIREPGALGLDDAVARAAAVLPPSPVESLRFVGVAVEVRTRDGSAARVDRRGGGPPTVVTDRRRPGDRLWTLVPALHEGRLGGPAVRWLYLLAGLAPAVLAVTGIAIWLGRPRARAAAGTDQTGQASRRQPISQNIHS